MAGYWGRLFDPSRRGPDVPDSTGSATAVGQSLSGRRSNQPRDFIIAILAATLSVLVRASLDPFLQSDHVFVLSLLAVMFTAWQCGLKPALLTLFLSMTAFVYFFVMPRHSLIIAQPSDRIAVGLFFFCGVITALLGEAQWKAQRRAERALAESHRQRANLEAEIRRRTEIEASLLQRESQLLESNDLLGLAERQAADAFALLETFFRNAPIGLAFFDTKLRYLRVNDYLARANGLPAEQHIGKTLADVLPHYPAEAKAAYQEVLRTGAHQKDLVLAGVRPGAGPDSIWSLNLYPVTRSDGEIAGVGVISEDVTERLRSERQLRESEARKTAVFESALDCIITIDHHGNVVEFNPAAEQTFGYSRGEIAGQSMAEFILPPRYWESHQEGMIRYLTSGDGPILNRRVELIGRRKDGREFPAEVSITPIDTGGPPLFTGYLRDITERQRSEAALAERAELALLRAEMGVKLATNDPGPDVLQQCAELLFEHLDAAFVRIWTLDQSNQVLELQASAGLYTHRDGPHGRVKVGEFKIGRIARDRRPLLTNDIANDPNVSDADWARAEGMKAFAGYPLLVENEVLGVLAVFAKGDLSEAVLADLAPLADGLAQWLSRQRAIVSLRASEIRFRMLTEAIPQMVWNANSEGAITYFNTRWLEYTGLSVAEAAEEGWFKAVHPEDRERVAAGWKQAVVQTSNQFSAEFRLRRAADHAYRWFLSAAVSLKREDGAVDQWIGSLTEIEAQKRQRETLEHLVQERTAELTASTFALRQEIEERTRAEELVRAASRELARSNEELEKFAYVASHDLQEPLRKIQAFGDRLKTRFKTQLTDVGLDYLDRVLTSATRMRRLIDDLLAFSRVTTKGLPFAEVDLNAVLTDVVSDLEIRIVQTAANVDVGPLPTLAADPSQMRQLFQNLIGNALKFHRPEETPVVRIRGEMVAAHQNEAGEPVREHCRITVEDNGIGFDIKYLERIFQVFQRLHGREEYEGTGVGLAICRKIVERHNGTITATSTKGSGATFVLTLPLSQPQVEFVPYGEAE